MYASRQPHDHMVATAHCTETDKTVELQIHSIGAKQLVCYTSGGEARMVFTRSDTRRPYVCNRAGLEFTVLDADIE